MLYDTLEVPMFESNGYKETSARAHTHLQFTRVLTL